MKQRIRTVNILLVIGLLLLGLFVIPLPYFVTKPGMAEPLESHVKVEGAKNHTGEFMMTTVAMGRASVYTYLESFLNPLYQIYKKDEVMGKGETDDEYNFRQHLYMEDSKKSAIITAYRYAGKPYEISNNGVLVAAIVKDMPANGVLKIGDLIQKINGQPIHNAFDIKKILQNSKPNSTFILDIVRNNKQIKLNLKTAPFKKDPNHSGFGVSLLTNELLKTTPPVKIETEKIGGPSAGLMFTLEIYDQLADGNLTKGHEIAGTGTIDENGNVGPIGGISQKIAAASKAGADIFFAPAENGAKNSNYNEAKKTVEKYHFKIKLVPVNTFKDAVQYLQKLPSERKAG
jgi:PDZ domain-containing protein